MTNELGLAVSELGFVRWHWVWERASVADIFRPPRRCGIYVLSFSNGEAYVGQAVDVTRRYGQHRIVHADIEIMTFKAVRRQDLIEEERTAIRKLESAGIKLRNVIFTSYTFGPSDFDVVMTVENQDRWLADIDYVDPSGPRTEDPETRRRFGRRYQQLLKLPEASDAVKVLRTYVRLGTPAFPRSEMSFWICSCLPGYLQYRLFTYARISVYQQEVLSAYFDEGQLYFSWHLAKSPLERAFGPSLSRMRQKFPSVEVDAHTYEPGGQDQISLWTRGANAALSLMRDPDVLRSIRLFNLRMMKKGPCMFSRYHCFDLADRFYEVESDVTRHADAASHGLDLAGRFHEQETDSILSRVRSLFGRH